LGLEFEVSDVTVGAGFKPARIIAAPVATRTIATFAIGSFVCQAMCPHPDTAIMQLARINWDWNKTTLGTAKNKPQRTSSPLQWNNPGIELLRDSQTGSWHQEQTDISVDSERRRRTTERCIPTVCWKKKTAFSEFAQFRTQ